MNSILKTVDFIEYDKWSVLNPRKSFVDVCVPNKITIHHHLMDNLSKNSHIKTMYGFDGISTMRELQEYDVEVDKLNDIRYHCVIDYLGRVWQCRDFRIPGAHVRHRNNGNIGILMYGNYEMEIPTQAQFKAFKKTLIELSTMFPMIQIPSCVFAHREFAFTECPGLNMYHIINDLKYHQTSIFDDLENENW